MRYLFDETGLNVLKMYCRKETLFAFDFDGTLAPLVTDPKAARMRDSSERSLRELARTAEVAVISGRLRSQLAALLPSEIKYLLGNHGMEGLASSEPALAAAARTAGAWKEQLQRIAWRPGIWLEDKSYSLTLHFREADDHAQALAEIRTALARLDPPARIVGGHCVVNLVLARSAHKGKALLELLGLTGSTQALYVGDDDNDEDVFELAMERLLSIRVGFREGSAARFYLKDQGEIDRLLAFISARCSAGGA